ncbi:MAG: DUF3750 domain-containing protein [Armatimonadetes bacterium]|nr:DUF3750 domain-containing protein [Armatimonadota bacterium]
MMSDSAPPSDAFPSASPVVELWYAPLPPPLSQFAWHHWFVVREGDRADRWEVWQTRNAGGESRGHVVKNLMAPDRPVGGGDSVCLFTWRGDDAESLVRALRRAWENYPFQNVYRAFPGPNSNTFVAWILRRAGLGGDAALLLKRQAIGRGWWLG